MSINTPLIKLYFIC